MNKRKMKNAFINVGRSPALIKAVLTALRDINPGFRISAEEKALLAGREPYTGSPAKEDLFLLLGDSRELELASDSVIGWGYRGQFLERRRSKVREFNAATQLGALLEYLGSAPESVSVRVNDEYTAIIHPDHIEVGCQKFDGKVVLELAEVIKGKKTAEPGRNAVITLGSSEALRKAVFAVLTELGIKSPYGITNTFRNDTAVFIRDAAISGTGDAHTYSLSGYPASEYPRFDASTQLGDIIAYFSAAKAKAPRVKLNDEFEAVVNGKGIRVGPYRIANEVVLKVAEEIERLKS